MERITFAPLRTTKAASEPVRIRFRLRDGRDVDLYHKSDLTATPEVLKKFNQDCTLKPKVFNVDRDLVEGIAAEVAAMRQAYKSIVSDHIKPNSKLFEERVAQVLDPEFGRVNDSIVARLQKYVDDAATGGLFGTSRTARYNVLCGKLTRFLTITGRLEMTVSQFNVDVLMEFRNFLFDEFLYVPKWRGLYVKVSKHNTPTQRLEPNTVAIYMKALRAFFNVLENNDEVARSPFKRIGVQMMRKVIHETKATPVCLYKEEFQKVMATPVPKSLQETKDAFLVQCAFGCRISDFQTLTMDNVSVTPTGIPFIHYLPKKTRETQADRTEVATPIVKFAFDILMRRRFSFPIITYPSGKSGYNVKIKALLKHCGIDRTVSVSNEESRSQEYKPLWEVGGSKLCRKTHVDMLNKVQINMYAAGLHRQGSEAVKRYTNIELQDRFTLLCAAFDQPAYAVTPDLSVVE